MRVCRVAVRVRVARPFLGGSSGCILSNLEMILSTLSADAAQYTLHQLINPQHLCGLMRTVALSAFKSKVGDCSNGPFWWKSLFNMDDNRDHVWSKIAKAGDSVDREELIKIIHRDSRLTSGCFRRNRIGRGNSRSKRSRKTRPSRIPSLATSESHLLALKRLGIPPLVIGGFKTNGYELHIEVMTQDVSTNGAICRNRIDGFDHLHKKGFDQLRDKTDNQDEGVSKGSKWDRKTTRGVYGSICANTETNSPSSESKFCVVDPGQINPLTLRTFSLRDGMACESPNDETNIVTEADYHHEVGSTDNKLWEMAIKNNPDLKAASVALSEPVRTLEERHGRICTEARHWDVLWQERQNIKYDRNRMQRRCCRDAYTVKMCKWIKSQGCTAVWFGTGSCRARGHRPVYPPKV